MRTACADFTGLVGAADPAFAPPDPADDGAADDGAADDGAAEGATDPWSAAPGASPALWSARSTVSPTATATSIPQTIAEMIQQVADGEWGL